MGERPDDPLSPPDPSVPADSNAEAEATADTAQISAEIEATRADLGDTIDELQERLSPQQIVSNATDAVTAAAKETARDLAHQAGAAAQSAASMTRDAVDRTRRRIARDPLPLALLVPLGAGVAFAMRQSRRRRRTADRDDLESSGAFSAPGIATRSFEETRGTSMSTTPFQRAITDNPMAMGLAALAAGAAVGLMLPATEMENEHLGETRDAVVDSAKEVAAQAAERVQDAVKQTADEITGPNVGDE
jgi:hypothetical protein